MLNLKNVWGEPLVYKGLLVYPVKMCDSREFYECVGCLTIEKNKSPDVAIIKMSYLKFLIRLACDYPSEYSHLIEKLQSIIKLVFRTEDISLDISDNGIKIIINGISIDENDFDDIKKYILQQNLIKISEVIYDEEVEKALNEAKEFMASKSKGATLEEQIVAFHCVSGRSFNEIKEYTIYQFSKCTERYIVLKNFEVYSSLLAENGASKDIHHWLDSIQEKGFYDDVLVDKEDIDKMASSFST